MAKVLTTVFEILGKLDGSFMGAIRQASGAMAGLKRSMTGSATLGAFGDLSKRLNELRAASAALEKFKALSRGGLIGGLDQLRTAQREVQRLRLELQAAREAGNKALVRSLESQLRGAERTLTGAFKGYGAQTSELKALYQALSNAGIKVRDLASAEAQLKAALSGANAAMKSQEQFAKAYQAHTDASNHVSTAWDNMQSAFTTAGALMRPFASATENAETFEHAMSRVRSLTQSQNIKEGNYERVRREMAELESQARQLGATTQFTMTQAAEAQGFLGMAGWSKDQIIKAMPGMLDLAAASGMDLARTADIVSDNLTALGMTADQVGHMTDVYAYALTRSNLNMDALGESMKYAAPAMHAYGGDIHDAAAAMMIMGNAGIKGSMAGTALRMGLLRLAGPPKKASKEMEALGVSLSDATRMAYESQAQLEALGIHVDAGMKPTEKMSFVLRELSAKMEGLSKDEKLAAVGAIFGVNAASGWLAVLEQGPEKFEEFRNALRESDGTAKQVARTMNDDTRGAWLYLESAIDAVSNNVGSAFLPMLRSMYEGLNPIVTSLAEWIGRNQGLVRAIGALAAGLSVAIVGLAGFRLALAGISFVQTTAGLLSATAGLGVFGRLGATVFGSLFGKLTALSTIIKTQGIATGFKALGYGLMASVSQIPAALSGALSGVVGLLSGLGAKLGAVFAIAKGQGMLALLQTVGYAFSGAARSAAAFLLSPWGVAIAAIAAIAAGAYMIYQNWDKVGGYFEGVLGRISAAASGIGEKVMPALEQISGAWSRLSESFGESGLGNVAMGGLLAGIEVLTGVLTTALTLVGTFLSTVGKVGAALMDAFGLLLKGDILGAIGKLGSAFQETLGGAIKMVVDLLKGLGTTLGNVVKIAGGVLDGSILAGKFDWGALGGKEKNYGSATREAIGAETELTTTEKESLTLEVRQIARSDAEDKVSTLVERLTATGNQTASQQAEMMTIVRETFKDREGGAEIISAVEAKLSDVQASTEDRIATALIALSEKEKIDGGSKEEFLSSALENLKEQTNLTASQQDAILSRVSEAIDKRSEQGELVTAIREAVSTAKTETAADRDALVQSLSTFVQGQSDKEAALRAAIEYLKTQKDVSEAAREDMISSLQEIFDRKKDDGEQVTRALEPVVRSMEGAANKMSDAAVELPKTLMPRELPWQQLSPTLGTMKAPELDVTGLQGALDGAAATTGVFNGQLQETGMATAAFNGQMLMTGEATTFFGAQMTASAGATGLFNEGVTGAGSAASGATGALSGLGAAASSAIGALMSAASSAGAAISGALSNAYSAISNFVSPSVSHNAVGGIYPRGEFVTTFAEDSPEAAIPIEKTKRSKTLWEKVGELLGVLPDKKEEPRKPTSIMSGSKVKLPVWLDAAIKMGKRLKKKKGTQPSPADPTTPEPPITPSTTEPTMPGRPSIMQRRLPFPFDRLSKTPGWPKVPTEPNDPTTPEPPMLRRPSIMQRRLPWPLNKLPQSGRWPSPDQSSPQRRWPLNKLPQSPGWPKVPVTEPSRLERSVATYDRLDREEREVRSDNPSEAGAEPITVNVTINGVKGAEEMIPQMKESLEEALSRLNHERSRRAYA